MELFFEPTTRPEYSIGDVARICTVPAHTIRFWEKEFGEFLSPQRSNGKQRRYSELHIKNILRVKNLLWTEGFSIKGAKRKLSVKTACTFTNIINNNPMANTNLIALNIAGFAQNHLTEATY